MQRMKTVSRRHATSAAAVMVTLALTLAAGLGYAASSGQNGAAKSFAQQLVEGTMAKHSAATEIGIATRTARGCRGIASTDAGDVGEKCEAEDVRAMSTGRATADKEKDGYDVSLPLHDAAGAIVGSVGIEFKLSAATTRASALAQARKIEREMAAQITSKAQLTSRGQ